jgi:phage tail-like protein
MEMGFVSVSGLNITTDVIPYRQGGHNTTTQKMPGQSDFGPLTLNKGLMLGDKGPMDWMRRLFSVQQGKGGGSAGDEFRFTVDIKVLAHPVTNVTVDSASHPVHAFFTVYNAWPTSVGFSDLDAGANAIIITSMTLAHEGWKFKVASKPGEILKAA